MKKQKIILVGAVAGGASAAARLRRLDEQAEIILFDRGEYISFANCGLPYYIGGEIREKAALSLQTPESFHARFRVDVRTLQEVTALDPAAKTLAVSNLRTGERYTEHYDKLILSPGASPIKPPIAGLDSPRVFSLRSIPDSQAIKDFIEVQKPKRALVLGGGAIGVEMAENLHRAGLAVTIVERQDQLLAPLDYDMACTVHRHLEEQGICLRLGCALQAVQQHDGGLSVTLDSDSLETDLLILAIGVTPESRLAAEAGLRVNERGAIVVDEHMRSSDPDIYAVGDAVAITDFVTGQQALIPLAGPANKQGRIAADNVCGLASRYTGTQGSAIVRAFDLTVASTGINEKTAQRLGLSYEKIFTLSANHASYYPGAQNLSIKTLFNPQTGKILGAQLIGGAGTDKRCDVLATAIRLGASAYDLTRLELCYAPPYSSAKDPVNMLGFAIENLLTGKVSQFHWHELAQLPRDGSVSLVDTRTALEYSGGHIAGFQNIPLDSLREHLHELPKDKPVYLTCQIGLRGYLACRILSQNGYVCYNLSGGYHLYHSIFGTEQLSTNPSCTSPEKQQ